MSIYLWPSFLTHVDVADGKLINIKYTTNYKKKEKKKHWDILNIIKIMIWKSPNVSFDLQHLQMYMLLLY